MITFQICVTKNKTPKDYRKGKNPRTMYGKNFYHVGKFQLGDRRASLLCRGDKEISEQTKNEMLERGLIKRGGEYSVRICLGGVPPNIKARLKLRGKPRGFKEVMKWYCG